MHEEGERDRLLPNQVLLNVLELLCEDDFEDYDEDELAICISQRLIEKELVESGPVDWCSQESKMKAK